MSSEQILLAAAGALALVALSVAVPVLRLVRRAAADAAAAHARVRALEERLAELGAPATRRTAPVPAAEEPGSYQITRIDDPGQAIDRPADPPTQTSARVEGRLFADIVAQESLIMAAGLTHGLRRALAPQTRNRIRFEMRREVKRARRQRRADLKAALRDLQARQRAELRDEGDAA